MTAAAEADGGASETLRWVRDRVIDEIPVARYMGVTLEVSADGGTVIARAPLERNRNHEGIAFGGSLATLATLAAWTVAVVALERGGLAARVLVREAHARYLRAVDCDLEAVARRPGAGDIDAFLADVRERGRGALRVGAEVSVDAGRALAFEGEFAALREDSPVS